MNKSFMFTLPLLVMLATSVASVSVMASGGDWYVSGNISYVDVDDADLDSNEAATGNREVDASFDSDVGFGLGVGYEFAGNVLGPVRLGAEYQRNDNDADDIDFQNIPRNNVNGSFDVDSVFVNIVQAFDGLPYGIQPYVGVGLGYVEVDSSLSYAAGATINDDDSEFGYQFLIGSSLLLTDSFDLFVEYRRTFADDLSLDRRGGGPGGLAITKQETDYESDAFLAGVRYRF